MSYAVVFMTVGNSAPTYRYHELTDRVTDHLWLLALLEQLAVSLIRPLVTLGLYANKP
jgi:hypothetical protein